MSERDVLGLALSYVFAFGLLGLTEVAGRKWAVSQDLTRKVIHIAAGTWVFGIILIFEHWWAGVIVPASFIVFNYIFYRRIVFRAMDVPRSTPGTVYFAFSVATLLAVLWWWGRPGIAAAGLMPMTWGDAMASLVGQRWGRHAYALRGSRRSWEGSGAMFCASTLTTFVALIALRVPASMAQGLLASLLVAVLATVIEALSPRGLDNITVPFVSTALLWLIFLG